MNSVIFFRKSDNKTAGTSQKNGVQVILLGREEHYVCGEVDKVISFESVSTVKWGEIPY